MFTRLALVAGLLIVVGLGAMTHVAAIDCTPSDTVCQKLQDAKQNQANATHRLQDIQQSIADAQQKATQTLAYINKLNAQIAGQQAAIADTKAKIAETERRIRLTSAEILRREVHLQIRQELLSQRVRAMDKHGSYGYLELIVTSRGFTELVNRIVIMQAIIHSDNHLVDTLRQERDKINALEQKLEQQRQEATLEQTRQTQHKALDYYRQLEAQFDAQRKELEAEKARIDALVNDLQAQYDAEARTLGGGSGQFGWPERGVITQLSAALTSWLSRTTPTAPRATGTPGWTSPPTTARRSARRIPVLSRTRTGAGAAATGTSSSSTTATDMRLSTLTSRPSMSPPASRCGGGRPSALRDRRAFPQALTCISKFATTARIRIRLAI